MYLDSSSGGSYFSEQAFPVEGAEPSAGSRPSSVV